MTTLDQHIKSAGGVNALAISLGLEANVVSLGRKRGIPDSWAEVLSLKKQLAYVLSVQSKHNCEASKTDCTPESP